MLGILFSWLSPLRFIGIWIDTIAFSLIDDAYNLIVTFSSGTLLKQEFVENLMDNFYVIIGIFALFRIAILLVNSMINPDKLSEKGNGLSNVLVNFLVMFVLLVMTPVIFKEAIDLQSFIVEGNYVQKLFINADALEGKDPGKAMRSIAIGSLITIDEEALEIYEAGKCSKNCKKAIEDYRKMEKDGFSFPTISKHIGVSIKNDDGDNVFVYNYMFLVTFAAGCFIAYVLFSFAIDIAVRMVELTVLQIIAPLFIATYIDPKSAKSGTFHNWLTTVGKTYASLFIKLAILALMLLLISVVGNLDYYASDLDLSGFEKLILLIAILIFSKKAPKWITEMIGLKTDGLGGLGIGKKVKDGLEPLNNKYTRAAAAVGAGYVGNKINNARKNHELKKASGKYGENGFGFMRKKQKDALKKGYTASDGKRYTGSQAVRQWKKDQGLSAGQKAQRSLVGTADAVVNGFNASKDTKGIISAVKGGAKVSADFNDNYIQVGPGLISKAKDRVDNFKDSVASNAYGSASDRYEAAEAAKKVKTRKKYFGDKAYSQYGDNLIGGMGDFSKAVTDEHGNVAHTKEDAMAMCYAKAIGGTAAYDKNGNLQIEYKDKDNNVVKLEAKDAANLFSSMLTSSGAAHFNEMYNKKQSSVLNEYTTNQESINRATQTMSDLNNNISSQILGHVPNCSQDPRTGALQVTGVDGSPIKIDTNDLKGSLNGLEISSAEAFNKANTDYRENRITEQEFNAVSERANNVKEFISTIREDEYLSSQMHIQERENATLTSLIERNKILLNTVNEIGVVYKNSDGAEISKYEYEAILKADIEAGNEPSVKEVNAYKTIGQKSEKLALDADSISKKVAGVDAADKDDTKK